MPISPVRVVYAYWSVSYDGVNGTDIAAAIVHSTIISDTGSVLTLDYLGVEQLVLNVGDWIVWRDADGHVDMFGTYTDANYHRIFDPLPS